jgi:hypothetical protein
VQQVDVVGRDVALGEHAVAQPPDEPAPVAGVQRPPGTRGSCRSG